MAVARKGMNAEAARLGAVRTEAQTAHGERLDNRLIDLICKELASEFPPEAKPAGQQRTGSTTPEPSTAPQGPASSAASTLPAAPQLAAQAPAPPETTATRAASAIELIEKIETFVRSQRPALALTLVGRLGARVEIERVGPKEVSVRLRGKHGPPSPEEVTQIREGIREKGLVLSSLSVS
jgi:hypothetical protein